MSDDGKFASSKEEILRNLRIRLTDGDWKHPTKKDLYLITKPFEFFINYSVLEEAIKN